MSSNSNGNGNGLFSELVKDARRKGQKDIVDNEPIDVVDDIFQSVDQGELKKQAQKIREEENGRRKEIADACEVSTKMVNSIINIERFFATGDPEEVNLVQSHPESVPMVKLAQMIRLCKTHFQDGSVEQNQGKFIIGAKKLHCVIPARLAGLKVLQSLAFPQKKNEEDELRGLWMSEITDIAIEIGAVIEAKAVANNCYLKSQDHRLFIVGEEKKISPEQSDEFLQIVNTILVAGKTAANKFRKEIRKSLREQVTVHDIEEAVERGGIYLAHVPVWQGEIKGERKNYPGGQVLLNFSNSRVTIGNNSEPFVEGHFTTFVSDLREKNAAVPLEDVIELLQGNYENPKTRKEREDMGFWRLIQRHVRWVSDFRNNDKLAMSMRQTNDLSVEAFLRGEAGQILLKVDSFVVKNDDDMKEISPAAIRVEQLQLAGKTAIRLIETLPELMPIMGAWIGENKIFPRTNAPGELRKFLEFWERLAKETVESISSAK